MCEALSKILTFNKSISVTFFWYINKTVFAGQLPAGLFQMIQFLRLSQSVLGKFRS